MTLWTTDSVQRNQRFDLWQGVVCESINNVTADCAERKDFTARLVARTFGSLKMAWFHSGEHRVKRTPQHIRSESDHAYLVSLQVAGRSSIVQGESAFHLDPDELAIVDTAKPFELVFSPDVERLVAVLPRASLEARIPWLKRHHTLKIGKDAPYSELSRSHIRELVSKEKKLDIEASLLAENVCNLLALATRDSTIEQLDSELQLEMILSFCRANIADPHLSPGMVAGHFAISLRTLHVRFERIGQTFGEWVLARRLDACRQALQDPLQSRSTITEIVYRNGFNDLSHFCRMFKRHYGQSARAWRLQATKIH
jgi:AraC-like DNA-binding protein